MFCHRHLSLNIVFATMLSWEFWVLITGQIYFLLPGEVVLSDRSIVVSKASWCCIVLLGQPAQSKHFALCCSTS